MCLDLPADDALNEGVFVEISNLPEDFDPVDEAPDMPAGWAAVLHCPNDINKLSGKKIMFRWDAGWLVGTVKNRIRKGQYNYFVRYKEDDGTYVEYRHILNNNNYYHAVDETPDGVWFVLEPDVLAD